MLIALLLLLQSQEDLRRWVERLDADVIEVREGAERALMDAGEPARSLVQSISGGRAEPALRARRILRWLDVDSSLPPVALAVDPGLRKALRDPDPHIRREAVFGRLERAVRPGESYHIVSEVIQGVLPAFLDDPDPALRAEAATDVENDPDGRAAEIALDFLTRYGHPDFERLCGKEYGDELRVERACQRVIRSGRFPSRSLGDLLESPQVMVRVKAIWALRKLRSWEAADRVRPLLADSQDRVVVEAIRFLAACGKPGEAAVYENLAQERNSRELLHEVSDALVRLEARATAPRLIEMALGKEDPRNGALLFHAAVRLDPAAARPEATRIIEEAAGKEERRVEFVPYAVEARWGGATTRPTSTRSSRRSRGLAAWSTSSTPPMTPSTDSRLDASPGTGWATSWIFADPQRNTPGYASTWAPRPEWLCRA